MEAFEIPVEKLTNDLEVLTQKPVVFNIINGDCLEKMDILIEQGIKVDMVLVDPPYGTTKCKWDTCINFTEMWNRIHMITKEDAAIVIFASEPFASLLRVSNIKEYRYDLYWRKEKPTNFFQLKKRFGKCTENICVFYRNQPTYNPQMRKHVGALVSNKTEKSHSSVLSGKSSSKITEYNDTGLRYPSDILQFNRVPLRKYVHPTQKPVELLEYLIKSFTNEGDLVLDFTMGSGSTGVACKNLSRNFIGIELDEEYFTVAVDRLKS